MARHEMRTGDTREFRHDPLRGLKWWPMKGYPFRWKPEHGEPECIGEVASQTLWKHRIELYVAFVVTLILLVQLFGISFVGGS